MFKVFNRISSIKNFYREKRKWWAAKLLLVMRVPGFVLMDYFPKTDKKLYGVQYYSQVYQDMYLDSCIFHGKNKGIFLDVGGNDPVHINNTYFFEATRNWTGLAFEPVPRLNARWKAQRKVECLPYALGSIETDVEFCEYEKDYMSGVKQAVDFTGAIKNKYTVPMKKLSTVLNEKQINYVDFMSLDVEGSELDVLKGIDFQKVYIYCIVIENNKGKKKETAIRKFLLNLGFKLQAKLWIDEIWINQNIIH